MPIAKQAWPTLKLLLLLPSETGCSASSRLFERARLDTLHHPLSVASTSKSTTQALPKQPKSKQENSNLPANSAAIPA
jgi:hypothetical protein